MALKGLDIFKLTPKTNCKDCGNPTCMAFAMKVAQGALSLDKCPHLTQDVIDQLSEATAPPMKSIAIGAGGAAYNLGGETVLYRHEKTFVSKSLYATYVCDCMDDATVDARLAAATKVDYERIGERMYAELLYVRHSCKEPAEKYAALVAKALKTGRTLVLGVKVAEAAKAALALAKDAKPVLDAATKDNYEEMNALATEYGVTLGVRGETLDEIYDTVAALEKLGNKNLVIDVTGASIKDTFRNAVEVRRAALKDGDRTTGYPSIVNLAVLANGDLHLQAALASVFTLKYGSIIVMETIDYPQSLPLHGLRQNIFTDPQKPMKVEPGIYPLNGADENAICATTSDFALTYFVVSGEIERSKVPVNLLISDAGGYSVLTAWAAGKLSAGSLAKFFAEHAIESKVKSRTLLIPGKVAVLKGEIQDKLPGWNIVVAPNEAIQLVKFLRDFK